MVSRKKAAGKARKAAKAKAREVQAKAREEEERNNGQSLVDGLDRLSCKHGADSLSSCDTCIRFVIAFSKAHGKAIERCDGGDSDDMECIVDAHVATMEREEDFLDMWKDSTKVEIATSYFLCEGVEAMIEGRYDDARLAATVTVYFEQTMPFVLGQTQRLTVDFQKVREVRVADLPTLASFFRSRIPCSCLDDEKYSTNGDGVNQEQTLSLRQQQPLDEAVQQLPCKHGVDALTLLKGDSFRLVNAFRDSFLSTEGGGFSLTDRLKGAEAFTWDDFFDVWDDPAKMEIAIACSLFAGAQCILIGNEDVAREIATVARYFEQHIAVRLKQTQALFHLPKISEANSADDHTLVKFFRRRIPCSCLDKKYEEVKHIPKMGFCFNPQCSLGRYVERSKTKYCSRCRYVTYCSRECQEARWSIHKPLCDTLAAMIAEFEAKQQNMSIEHVPQS